MVIINVTLLLLVSFVTLFFGFDPKSEPRSKGIHPHSSIDISIVSNCSSESLSRDVVPILEQCRIACGSRCHYCGQVYAFCLDGGFLTANFSRDACNIAFLDYVPVASSCPFLDSLEKCCNSTLPIPPVEPISLECTDQTNLDVVYERLTRCQEECGSRCSICGQVWNYCKQSGRLERSLNYTVEACAVLTLDSIPTVDGPCPFNATLDQCCFERPVAPVTSPTTSPTNPPIEPPVNPPVLSPVTSPIAPPVVPPVQPPVQPPLPPYTPTAYCPLTQSNYVLVQSCMENQQAGTCAQRTTVGPCSGFIADIANTTTVRNCLLVGFNTSVNQADCDVESVVRNCCNPSASTGCPVNLGRGEGYTTYVNNLLGSIGSLTVAGNAGWFGSIETFGTVTVSGTQTANDTATLSTINNVVISIANRPSPITLANLTSDITFTPGYYKCNSGFDVANNVVITLDAQTNPYAVFIFYASFYVTIGDNVTMVLINGAHPSNVFFATSNTMSVGSNDVLQANFLTTGLGPVIFQGNDIINGRYLVGQAVMSFLKGVNTVTTLPALKNPVCL